MCIRDRYNTVGNDWFLLTGDNTGFYQSNFQMRGNLAVGRSSQAIGATLDVGDSADTIPAAWFRNGVVVSNNPSGVQVDNTSMVIGAGNNDNVSGSDHCLIVGSGNQITSNSDQSVAFGQGNAVTSSIDAFAVGNSNTLTSSIRTQALGFNNTVTASSSFVAGGGNSITANSNIFALGDGHTVTTTGSTEDAYLIGSGNTITGGTGSFAIGSNLDGDTGNHMVVGYRNDKTSYPTTNYSLGLGNTKFALAVGSTTTTNSNALLITEGGVNRGGSGVAQVPRVVLPTIVGFNFADDTAALAGGIPFGGLYHNAGALRINLLGSSPGPGTGEVEIGNLIWTDVNSTIVASSAGTIPILTTEQQAKDAYDNSTAGAFYYDFNSANAARGLFYNQFAANVITPPTGFRLPSLNDWADLQTEFQTITGASQDATPGGGGASALWNSNIKANADYGSTGFDAIKAGYYNYNSISNTFTFESEFNAWWRSGGTTGIPGGKAMQQQTSSSTTIFGLTNIGSGNPYWTIRFCKDVP